MSDFLAIRQSIECLYHSSIKPLTFNDISEKWAIFNHLSKQKPDLSAKAMRLHLSEVFAYSQTLRVL